MMDVHFEDEEEKTGESDFNTGDHFITLCGGQLQGMKKHISKSKDILASLDSAMKKRISELNKMQGKVIDLNVSKTATEIDSKNISLHTDKTTGKYRTDVNKVAYINIVEKIRKDESAKIIKFIGILQKYTQVEQRVVAAYSTNFMIMIKFDSKLSGFDLAKQIQNFKN